MLKDSIDSVALQQIVDLVYGYMSLSTPTIVAVSDVNSATNAGFTDYGNTAAGIAAGLVNPS